MAEPSIPSRQDSPKEQLERAHSLLQALRDRLERHPELEEAIERVEMALSALTVKTGGML